MISFYMRNPMYRVSQQRPISISLPDDISVKMRAFYENETATPRHHLSFLSLSPTSSPAPTITKSDTQLFFSNPHEMLDYVTRRWQDNFVTSDLQTRAQIEMFIKRPFFLLVSVDAPLYDRYRRSHGFVFSLDKRTCIPHKLLYLSQNLCDT